MRIDFQFNARRVLVSAGLAVTLAFAAPYAFAHGGGGGGGGGSGGGGGGSASGGGGGGQDLTTCPKGEIWDVRTKRCLTLKGDVLPDAQIVEYAFALAKAQRFDEALQTLDLLKDPNTPRALNYRGYATRKLGRTDEGIGYYLQSVAMDPTYAQVREYLGEAYVLKGKFDLAHEQLDTIAKICGSTDCEEYEDLSKAIANPDALAHGGI
ncbi:MAG: tetratricopeptide repeat protein [Roseiarcus sp.]|jgi:tetratricopeptide (TPR) repeat protein